MEDWGRVQEFYSLRSEAAVVWRHSEYVCQTTGVKLLSSDGAASTSVRRQQGELTEAVVGVKLLSSHMWLNYNGML